MPRKIQQAQPQDHGHEAGYTQAAIVELDHALHRPTQGGGTGKGQQTFDDEDQGQGGEEIASQNRLPNRPAVAGGPSLG